MPRFLFTRRPNADGTTDSICNKCFVTVVTAIGEGELDQAEKHHLCDPGVLEYWKRMLEEKRQELDRWNLDDCSHPPPAA